MATVSITIPDALVPRVITAMRALYPQYAALSDAACFKRITADNWREVLAAHEGNAAYETTRAAALGDGGSIG